MRRQSLQTGQLSLANRFIVMIHINHKYDGFGQRTAFPDCNAVPAASGIKIDPALNLYAYFLGDPDHREKRKSVQRSLSIEGYAGVILYLAWIN